MLAACWSPHTALKFFQSTSLILVMKRDWENEIHPRRITSVGSSPVFNLLIWLQRSSSWLHRTLKFNIHLNMCCQAVSLPRSYQKLIIHWKEVCFYVYFHFCSYRGKKREINKWRCQMWQIAIKVGQERAQINCVCWFGISLILSFLL